MHIVNKQATSRRTNPTSATIWLRKTTRKESVSCN